MSRSFRDWFLFVVVAGFALPGSARTPAASRVKEPLQLKLTVRVYNHARVPGETLERAKAEAAALFRKIRVGTAWVDCTLPGTKLPNDPGCSPRHGPTDLVLRIVPRSMTERYGFRRGVLGFALNAKKSRFGYAAYVFLDRLQGLPGWRSAAEQPVILGHLIAHEIGHLLLGYQKHSLAGLMRPGWDRKQRNQAVSGTLHFIPWQANRIRADVRDRMRAAPQQLVATPDSAVSNITIRVYDYAEVPAPVAKRARKETSRIFREVGIETEWASCPIPGQSITGHPRCKVRPLAPDIQLNILPRKMARQMMKDHGEFGAAFPLPNAFGSRASIFYHRVDELAESQRASRAFLLGHFMAHEIGHLLLSLERHADRGLMCGGWSREDLISMSQGTLLFHPEEAQRIRAQMLERIHASATIPGEVNPRPTIKVRVFNYADVGKRTLAGAKKHAREVLSRAEVKIEWLDCPASPAEVQTNTACRSRPAPTELVIRIVPRSQNPRCQLGFAALPKEKGNLATHASVFYEAAQDLAAGYSASNAQMLGYILAHEIGHLLLGEGSHAGKGIMRTPWRKPEMERAAEGRLSFTAKQARRMQVNVLSRVTSD